MSSGFFCGCRPDPRCHSWSSLQKLQVLTHSLEDFGWSHVVSTLELCQRSMLDISMTAFQKRDIPSDRNLLRHGHPGVGFAMDTRWYEYPMAPWYDNFERSERAQLWDLRVNSYFSSKSTQSLFNQDTLCSSCECHLFASWARHFVQQLIRSDHWSWEPPAIDVFGPFRLFVMLCCPEKSRKPIFHDRK